MESSGVAATTLVVYTASVALIVLLVFPLPFSLRSSLVNMVSKFRIPLFATIGVLGVCTAQEFNEQRKFGQRRHSAASSAEGSNLHYFAAEYFKHQRNMYNLLIGIVLCIIVLILQKLLVNFVRQHNALQDQLQAKKDSIKAAKEADNSSNNSSRDFI